MLDVREGHEFTAGHVPGARNAPFSGNLTADPQPVFRSPAELRARYEAVGAHERTPIVYCGSGVTSCVTLHRLALAGREGKLYPGSWSEWEQLKLPVERG